MFTLTYLPGIFILQLTTCISISILPNHFCVDTQRSLGFRGLGCYRRVCVTFGCCRRVCVTFGHIVEGFVLQLGTTEGFVLHLDAIEGFVLHLSAI